MKKNIHLHSFGSEKSLFIFNYFVNKLSPNLIFGLTIKQAESKHNNVFVNKLMSVCLDLINSSNMVLNII